MVLIWLFAHPAPHKLDWTAFPRPFGQTEAGTGVGLRGEVYTGKV